MTLYTVRKLSGPNKRGVECERWELYDGDDYVTGLEVPKAADHGWYQMAAKRIRANLLSRHDDADPQFGARADDAEALTLAGMLNYA